MLIKPRFIESYAQPAWVVGNDQITATITVAGAHMAPVVFDCGTPVPIRPYYISPWQGAGLSMPCPVFAPLRGDFLCMPFGGNATRYHGENHPPHGEVSGSDWTWVDGTQKAGVTTLTIMLETQVRPGKITRQFNLADGHLAIYLRSVVEGFTGKTSFGHHAILTVPETEKALLISTSPFLFGHTCPHPFSRLEAGEYQALAQDQEFSSLVEVPTIFKHVPLTDCSSYPARSGYADLLSLFEKSGISCCKPSISAVINMEDNYVFYNEGIDSGMNICLADFNADGKLDIVVTGKWGGPVWFENRGK